MICFCGKIVQPCMICDSVGSLLVTSREYKNKLRKSKRSEWNPTENNKLTCACTLWQPRLSRDFNYMCILKIFFLFNCSGLKEAYSKPQIHEVIFSIKSHPLTVGKLRIYYTKFVFKIIFLKEHSNSSLQ